ncbi:MAG: branched-chain amino acid ABC transporter permease [Paracoccaceae bacterium]
MVLFFLNDFLIPGIVIGSIYALGAIGVSLLFGNLRFANFGHGALMTAGAYVSLELFRATGLPILAVLPLSMVLTGLLGVAIDRVCLRPFRAEPAIISLIASIGIALMLRSAIQLVFGVDLQSFSQGGIQLPLRFFDGALRVQEKHLWIVGTALVLMLATHLLLTRTKTGKAMRAMADSPELARLSGIDTERVIWATWMISGGLAAAAGTLLGMDTQVTPTMGFHVLLPVFAAAILGGIGQPYGAMAGGLVIGIAQEMVAFPWIGGVPLISPSYKEGVAFALMVLILIVRPSGIFRGRVF